MAKMSPDYMNIIEISKSDRQVSSQKVETNLDETETDLGLTAHVVP